MASRFDYLDALSHRAVVVERSFSNGLVGAKDSAIDAARSLRQPFYSKMVEAADSGFEDALETRRVMMAAICQDIASRSLTLASAVTNRMAEDDVQGMVAEQVDHTLARLDSDATHRISQHQLNMKRIAILARSMRDRNAWDTSATLLRARESVENHSGVSLDSIGRKQRSERFARLFVRGLGMSSLVDSIVAMSGAEMFQVMTFEGEALQTLTVNDYESLRDSLFHPQASRYLRPIM